MTLKPTLKVDIRSAAFKTVRLLVFIRESPHGGEVYTSCVGWKTPAQKLISLVISDRGGGQSAIISIMAFPIKTCAVCGEEFELKPGKPGFANRCPDCSAEGEATPARPGGEPQGDRELNAARRKAMRDLLYRKDV